MKYYTREWAENPFDNPRIMLEYERYYAMIENEIPENVRKIIRERHDTHISRVYFEGNDYIMEVSKEVWGSARFIFKNAVVTTKGKIEDEWWLYNEIYKIEDKLEIHILFTEAETVIICDDIQNEVLERKYFRNLYKSEDRLKEKDEYYDSILDDRIVTTIINKEFIFGILENWEQIIFAFSQIYYIKSVNFNNMTIYNYYNFTENEKSEIDRTRFLDFEQSLKKYIEILSKYIDVIKDSDLKYVVEQLQEVYNRKNMPIEKKKQLYLKLNEKLTDIDFNSIYERILDCINEGLIE